MDEWKAYLFKGQEITHAQTGKDSGKRYPLSNSVEMLFHIKDSFNISRYL